MTTQNLDRLDRWLKIALKFANLVLVSVTGTGVLYMVGKTKQMYDFVKETRMTDRRQDESLANHTMLIDTRQQNETKLELKNTEQDGQISVIMAILHTMGK